MQSSTLQGLVQFLTFYYCALWLTQLYIVECYDLLGWKPINYLPVHSKKMFLVMIEISKIYLLIGSCLNNLCGLSTLRDLCQYNTKKFFLINFFKLLIIPTEAFILSLFVIFDNFSFVTYTTKGEIKCSFAWV